ncbi:DUF2975 domain-containing protein (plasmid) [Streptomyces goshikiensis]|uniref:DUF2975 domain-containing protein n=1 Tax=Streptomyces goshikiensis TaxID=1942 RepID=A0ABZ1RX45_9ACTN|nr:DUF2975 domain-containing protein [Streptomyces goshikiensis]
MSEQREIAQPLSTVVSSGTRVVIGLLLAGFLLNAISGSLPLWGSGNTCVSANWMSAGSTAIDTAFAAQDGAHVNAVPQYCAENPDAWQRTLKVLSSTPSLVLLVGGLVLLHRLTGSAAQDGIYRKQAASKLSRLAWWLVAGSIVSAITEGLSRAALLSTLTSTAPFSPEGVLHTAEVPYLALCTGGALLVFARILRAAARMREDLEGTI